MDAIHPGYGLLSENANFAEVCRASNIKFIGPPPEVTRLMGEKEKARMAMKKAKVPILPGSEGVIQSEGEALEWAKSVGFPVILKASAGGGGRGMRVIRSRTSCRRCSRQAQTEAANAFGNGDLYMEKFIERPRHIEFQVLADEHGNVISLGERECSIQRRHQKLIEEAPSLMVDAEDARRYRARPSSGAWSTIGYQNAGTIEFLMDEDGKLYFIEMNTRIQVEHPVTEMVTGHRPGEGAVADCRRVRSCRSIVPEPMHDSRPCDRVPHQCGASGEVHAFGGEDHRVQCAGREWRARGYGAVCGGRCASVLRLADCEADRAWQGPIGSDGADVAGARDVCGGGDPYDDPAAPADLCR